MESMLNCTVSKLERLPTEEPMSHTDKFSIDWGCGRQCVLTLALIDAFESEMIRILAVPVYINSIEYPNYFD